MSAQPLSTQYLSGIAWYADVADFAAKGGIGLPGNPSLPHKPWRDPLARQISSWWNPVATGVARTYRMIARNPDGSPKLCKVGSLEFFATYTSLAVVSVYRDDRPFLFSAGVPYLVDVTVPAEQSDINMQGTKPAVDYPIELRSNIVLVPNPSAPGGIEAWDYQQFLQATRPTPASPAEVRQRALAVLSGPMSDRDAIDAVRVIITNYSVPHQLI